MNTRSNHPNSGHRTSAVTKQFFRIRGEALIRWVGNADDWALARGSGSERGSKPVLQCPDEGCGQKLDSVERTKPRLTRFLRDAHGTSCSHFIPPGGAGRMTNEHMWLQGVVRDFCEQLGYSARLEVDLADVKVESPVPYAVEVQRVSTNFAKRTAQRRANGMKSLWLLPETEKQRDIGRNGMRHDDPLFKHPAVRLRYYWSGRNHKTMVPTQYLNREVWNAGATDKVDLYVAVTLWTLADDRSRFDRSSSMPLR